MKDSTKRKLYALFFGCVAISVGMMIGGIWVPVLLHIGEAVLAATFGGALGFWQRICVENEHLDQTSQVTHNTVPLQNENAHSSSPNSPKPTHEIQETININITAADNIIEIETPREPPPSPYMGHRHLSHEEIFAHHSLFFLDLNQDDSGGVVIIKTPPSKHSTPKPPTPKPPSPNKLTLT